MQVPSRNELVVELRTVREKGVLNLPSLDLQLLTELAVNRSGDSSVDTAVAIESLLREAVRRLGNEDYGHAVARLFGLTPSTRNLGPGERRKKAAEPLGMTPETFRTRHQDRVVRDLAGQILVVVGEAKPSIPTTSLTEEASSAAVTLSTAVPPPSGAPEHQHRRFAIIALVASLVLAASIVGIIVTSSSSKGPPTNRSAGSTTCLSTTTRSNGAALPKSTAPVEIRILQQLPNSQVWSDTIGPVTPGAIVRFLLSYKNGGDEVENQVVLRVNLAPLTLLVPNSACLYDVSHPHGLLMKSNDVDQGGFNIGNFGARANAYLLFSVAMPPSNDLKCGQTTFDTVGVARPRGMNEHENAALTAVIKQC